MKNRYHGLCYTCGQLVPAGAGRMVLIESRLRIECAAHDDLPAPPPIRDEKRGDQA